MCCCIRIAVLGNFPAGPVVKSLCFQCKGVQVRSLAGELRSHMLCEVAIRK